MFYKGCDTVLKFFTFVNLEPQELIRRQKNKSNSPQMFLFNTAQYCYVAGICLDTYK